MADPITIIIKKGTKADNTLVDGNQSLTTLSSTASDSIEDSQINNNVEVSSSSNILNQAVVMALINTGKQFGTNAISQFGNFTGNTVAQNKINVGLQLLGIGAALYAAPVLGSIALIGQTAINITNNLIETTKANNQAELLYQRSGNAALNGGRGTNN